MKYVQRLDETVTVYPAVTVPVRKMSRTFLAFQFVLIEDRNPRCLRGEPGQDRDKVFDKYPRGCITMIAVGISKNYIITVGFVAPSSRSSR